MTNMSDVSEVIDTVESAEGAKDLVSRTLALVEAPEPLKIKPFLDKPTVTSDGEIIANIKPIQYPVRDLHIAALHHYLDGAQFAVTTAEGMSEAKQVAARLSKLKTAMKDAYTTWNGPILEMTADARSKRDHIIAEVDLILAPIKEQIDTQAAIEAEVRTRKAREESERVAAHTAALKVLEDMPGKYLSEPSETIAKVVTEISSFDYLSRRDWQEYLPAATDAIRAAIATLEQHLTNAMAREELARIQATQAAADQERLEREQAAERERERIAGLRERIHNIELAPTTVVGATSEAIQKKLARLEQTEPSSFEEMASEATAAIENVRNVLQTMLDGALKAEAAQRQADTDAAELAAFRAAAARQQQEQQEAADRAANEARQAAEAEQREKQEQAEREQRERDEVARIARERAQAVAEILRDLLVEARPHVPAGDLAERIDVAIAAAQGE
jgi:hypothetical protein